MQQFQLRPFRGIDAVKMHTACHIISEIHLPAAIFKLPDLNRFQHFHDSVFKPVLALEIPERGIPEAGGMPVGTIFKTRVIYFSGVDIVEHDRTLPHLPGLVRTDSHGCAVREFKFYPAKQPGRAERGYPAAPVCRIPAVPENHVHAVCPFPEQAGYIVGQIQHTKILEAVLIYLDIIIVAVFTDAVHGLVRGIIVLPHTAAVHVHLEHSQAADICRSLAHLARDFYHPAEFRCRMFRADVETLPFPGCAYPGGIPLHDIRNFPTGISGTCNGYNACQK